MGNERQYRYMREDLQSKNASYVRNKNKFGLIPDSRLDNKIVALGIKWYAMGHSFEEAEIELQSDPSFVAGYNRAVNQDIVNDELYYLGMENFERGTPLVEIPEKYTKNEYFVRGYNEALRLSLNNQRNKSKR